MKRDAIQVVTRLLFYDQFFYLKVTPIPD